MKRVLTTSLLLFLSLIIAVVVLWKVSSSRTFQFFGGIVNHIPTRAKVVTLTFDDGPTPKTDAILAILAAEHIKATFFLIGGDIRQYPAEARKLVAAGHEIGNHTYSHRRMVLKSFGYIKKELEDTDRLIRDTGYQGTIQFRPPYGKKLVMLPYYLKRTNRKTILWTLEPNSYPEINASSAKIARYVVDNIKPGSIILLHAMYDEKGVTLHSLKPLIEGVKRKGYTFKTLNELLK